MTQKHRPTPAAGKRRPAQTPRRRAAAANVAATTALATTTAATAALLATLLLACVWASPAAAAATSSTPKTVFKPSSVRFLRKRATTVLPTLAEAAAAAAALPAAAGEVDDRASTGLPVEGPPLRGRRLLDATAATTNNATSAASGSSQPASAPGGSSSSSGNAFTLRRAWRALNAYETSTALGNARGIVHQPPDQGLAVGNGFAVSANNVATRVYDTRTGGALSPAVDLSVLFGVPPYTGPNQPEGCGDRIADPIVLWDPDLRRWFQTIMRAGLDAQTCDPTGSYYIDVAVSASASATGKYRVYTIYASNDGTNNSPLIPGCQTKGCFADYPKSQLSADALVITANNYLPDSKEDTTAVSVYVLDKRALAKGAEDVGMAEFTFQSAGAWDENAQVESLSPAYMPPPLVGKGAQHGSSGSHKGGGGSSGDADPYLLLSRSFASSQRLIRYALTGARAVRLATTPKRLEALRAALTLTASPVDLPAPVATADMSPAAQPRAGNFPLGQSLGRAEPGFLGGPDFRVVASAVGGGRQFGVFNTFVQDDQAGGGRRYAIYLAQIDASTGRLVRADVVEEPGEELAWPGLAVDRRGRGAIVCMASGLERYASVAVVPIAASGRVGRRQIALEGQGLEDDFTQYNDSPDAARDGDYAAATIEPETGDWWGAAEWVSVMSCPLAEWQADKTCGGTRYRSTNWDTGIVAAKLQ